MKDPKLQASECNPAFAETKQTGLVSYVRLAKAELALKDAKQRIDRQNDEISDLQEQSNRGDTELRACYERIEELERLRDETCLWREESQGEYWSTECGQAHCFTADGPRENNHNFCPYCRGRLTLKDG